MVGVILAAGDGERLKSSSNNGSCKPLRRINGKSLIEFSFDNLVKLGVDKAYIVVGKEGSLIEEAVGDEYDKLKLIYVYQSEQVGLINAFMHAVNIIDSQEDVIFQLADEIFVDFKAEDIKNEISTGTKDFYCGITHEDNPQKIKNNFSVATDENNMIEECIEKPEVIINDLKGTGFCIFRNNALQLLKNEYSEKSEYLYDLCDYLNWLVEKNLKGIAFCIAKKEFNVNTSYDVTEAQDYLKSINE